MRKNVFTYLLTLFFICLLFARDIVMAFPSVFVPDSSIVALHIEWADEESGRSRSSEENVRGATNEYLDGDHSYMLDVPVFQLTMDKKPPVNSSFKQTFYGSVLTPPPDKA